MLCATVSLLIIELAVVYAELRVSDILNAELLPSTLLLEGNVTRRSFNRRSPPGVPEELRRRPGNWSQAFTTMEFHRKMMNEFLCRNYVAEQILDDMATSGESLSSAWPLPLRSSGPVKKDVAPAPFSLPNKTTEKLAEERMDTEESSTESSTEKPVEENVSTPSPGLSEVARSAPMFRKKSSASLKKTRKKKKKSGERSSRRRTDIIKSNMLADAGSAAYKDWLTRTALLEDIYRHYDHLAVPSEDTGVASPAPVEENISEEAPDTNAGINLNPASASDTITTSSGVPVIPNLAAYEGGEVTGYAVTQGGSYPAVASPPSAASIAAAVAAAAAAATNQGAAGIVRPAIHGMPSASGPISEATSVVKGLSAMTSPSLLSASTFPATFPSYGARFPFGSGFSFPASPGFSGLPAFPAFTALPSQPALSTSVPTAAYGDRGGAFSHHGDSHVEYELPSATSPEEEYHHHVEHEHKGHGKLLSLEDLFDLVLTAIAFLAFGAFVVHLIMCLLNSGQSSYVPMMEIPVTAPGVPQPPPNTGAAAAGVDSGRRRRRRRRRDAVSGEAGVVLDGVAPAALDRAAASVITSIDAALQHIREREKREVDQSECFLRALCAHNRRSRSAPGMLRVWMPVWSLGLSWVVGRNTTYPAGSTLANLRAALLGLSGTRCRSAFPKCALPPTGPSAPSTTQPTPSTRQPTPSNRQRTSSTRQPTQSTRQPPISTRQANPSTTQSHPSTRQSHPSTRQSNPPTTQSHSSTTQSSPSTTQSHPSTRQSNPSTRQSNPSTRQSNPLARQSDSSTRQPNPTTTSTLDPMADTALPTYPIPPPTIDNRYPGPPGVGGYTHFTPIAVKTNRRRIAIKRRRKKP